MLVVGPQRERHVKPLLKYEISRRCLAGAGTDLVEHADTVRLVAEGDPTIARSGHVLVVS